MNIVRELRKRKGIQQKELAIVVGVSQPTVSDWEANKADPSGERLKKLAEYFGVDELFILGYGQPNAKPFIPADPNVSGVSETEQIVEYVLNKLNVPSDVPKTKEARILANKIDAMPKERREYAINVFNAIFDEYFTKGNQTDDT